MDDGGSFGFGGGAANKLGAAGWGASWDSKGCFQGMSSGAETALDNTIIGIDQDLNMYLGLNYGPASAGFIIDPSSPLKKSLWNSFT